MTRRLGRLAVGGSGPSIPIQAALQSMPSGGVHRSRLAERRVCCSATPAELSSVRDQHRLFAADIIMAVRFEVNIVMVLVAVCAISVPTVQAGTPQASVL
jgi:hypothetical protein